MITRSEYSPTEWTVRYDLEYQSDGIGYLHHKPGKFTNFELGTPIQEQAAPLSLDPSQFSSTSERDLFYEMYPEQTSYDTLPGDDGSGGGGLIMNAHVRAKSPQRGPAPFVGPWTFYTLTGWSGAARDAGLGCTATAGGCAIASSILSGAPYAPCFVQTCSAAVIFGVLNNVRPTRRQTQ